MSNTSINNSSNSIESHFGKCLVVDDEISINKTIKRDFFQGLNLPKKNVIFVSNYEDSLKIIRKEQNISTCFLDSRIPKNSYDPYDYSSPPEWGIALIPSINEIHKHTPICVYSAYVNKSYMREKSQGLNNIVAFLDKSDFELNPHELYLKNNQIWMAAKKFSYLSTDNELSNFLFQETEKLSKLFTRTVEDIINIGTSLNSIKSRLGHGQFLKWLEAEFKMSNRTASRFMRVAEKFKLDNVSNLDIQPSALYELSKSTVPEAAVDEAIIKAKRGETVTRKTVISLKDKHLKKTAVLPTTLKRTRVKETAPNLSELEKAVSEESVTNKSSQKEQILRVVRQQKSWQLGRHFLFCGDPNSDRFIQQLPPKIILNLTFPAERNWFFSYPHQIDTELSLFSIYQSEIEVQVLELEIENIIRSTTDEGDAATICFIPNPIVFQVAHKLGLRCFIADPDFQKCNTLVTLWEDFRQK
jgi:hypothetical protein